MQRACAVRLHRDFQIPRNPWPPPRNDPRYWRISLCNASPSNRGIQLSSGNMCGDTVEFCMRMHFGVARFSRRSRGGWRGRRAMAGASFRAFHPPRLCGILRPRTSRNYISRERRGDGMPFPFLTPFLPSFHHSHGCHLLKFKTPPLVKRMPRFRIESRCNFERKISRRDKLRPSACVCFP